MTKSTLGISNVLFITKSLLLFCALVASEKVVAADVHNAERPNVLFIAIDDLRPELGCYGADYVISPNIDKLAAEGIQFNRAYCQFPVCGPSRASLLSGVYPTESRFVNNTALVQREVTNGLSMPATFREAGYHTVANGKIYHHVDDSADGWSEPPTAYTNWPKNNNHSTFHDKDSANYIGGRKNRGPFFESPDVSDETYIDGQICEKTIKDLKRLSELDKPFFLACGFIRPHLPFYAPKKYWDLYERESIVIADNRYQPVEAPSALRSSGEILSYHDRDVKHNSDEFHTIARHGYFACVSYADVLVGKLLNALEQVGVRDNTIVILWGDHGWNLGEHNYWAKNNLLNTAMRSPLIIYAPGFEGSKQVDGIVELIDMYPTLCELAGIDKPSHLEGSSMVPLMRDPKSPGKKFAITRDTRGVAITTDDYVYAEYNKDQRLLFDLKKDPKENVNVVNDSDYRETVLELSKLLVDKIKSQASKQDN